MIFDRATHNPRAVLLPEYDRPRYFTKAANGMPDLSARWPGWDGWYFFLFPDDRALPIKMIRGSLMTGLYGLDGIDNNRALPPGLTPFEAVERLFLAPCEQPDSDGKKVNLFSHEYLPKRSALAMQPERLEVSVSDPARNDSGATTSQGRMCGAWPHYQFDFTDRNAGFTISVNYRAEDIVWWADIPEIFTYFATFGVYEGSLRRLPAAGQDGAPGVGLMETPLRGRGGFEHGFARKPFDFTALWRPVSLINDVVPGLHPVHYDYQLLIGDDGLHGGIMQARGFGINVRNLGGYFVDGNYAPVGGIDIRYGDYETRDGGIPIPREWRVAASTPQGILEYTAVREWPAAPVSRNMTYYNFGFTGSYLGRAISGRGYGEYLDL